MLKPNPPIVTFSSDDYVVPQSSAMPKYQFFFQVIKDGIIVSKVNIKKKDFHLIGRHEDLCDIFIDNPTISRKHAILQFHKEDPLPSLYDLGSAQGTFVNKQQLPSKAYKKLQLFSNIKFGISSRYYVLRCPQLQQKQNQEEEEKQNQFAKTLAQQNKMLSKQQAKAKYLQLLESDPYFGGQLKSRKFQGQKKNSYQNTNQNDDGISWGIGDQSQVYAFKNQRQFPIQPDVIRRLPGLDQNTLQKIAQYQEKFRIYDEIENELNELANKQKRQYGLEEKLQTRKEKLQKKFMESLQALQRCQDWIRVNIFGDENHTHAERKKKKQKQKDTFSDDEFFDRTLQEKQEKKDEKVTHKKKDVTQQTTVQDLWMLRKNFISELTKKKQLSTLNKTTLQQEPLNFDKELRKNQQQEPDQLQQFMRQNEQNLEKQNKNIYARQIDLVQEKLKELKQKLMNFLSEKQISKIEDSVLNPQKQKQKEQKKKQKEAEELQNLQKTLQRIEQQQKARRKKHQKRRKLEQQCSNEYSYKIFELYKQVIQEQQGEYDDEDEQHQSYKRPSSAIIEGKNSQSFLPRKRVHTENQNQNQNQHNTYSYNIHQADEQENEQKSEQQQKVFDLTQKFN